MKRTPKPKVAVVPPSEPPSEIDRLLAKFSPDYQTRLKGLYQIWMNPKGSKTLKEMERMELLRTGIIPNEKPDERWCNTTTEAARLIAERFKVDCRKQYITRWRKGERLPHGISFPAPDPKSNRYDVQVCLDWYEKYILKSVANSGNDLLKNLAEERDKAELEEIAHQRFLRQKEIGEYVHRTVALASGVAAVQKIHQLVKIEDERDLPKMRREKLAGLGAAADIVAVFTAWDAELGRTITDQRERAMQEVAKEIPK